MLKKLFRKKNINIKSDEKLNRCLTSFDLTLLGIGCIIGTGIFVLTGIAAANQAGPAVILSFLASGFACAFAARFLLKVSILLLSLMDNDIYGTKIFKICGQIWLTYWTKYLALLQNLNLPARHHSP